MVSTQTRNPISPHHVMKEPEPLRRISAGCLVKHLTYIPMWSLNLSIRFGIIRGDFNFLNSIFLFQPCYCRSIRTTVIGDNLCNATPSTDDVLKEPVRNGLPIFVSNSSALHPGCHSTPAMDDVTTPVRLWRHMHRICM